MSCFPGSSSGASSSSDEIYEGNSPKRSAPRQKHARHTPRGDIGRKRKGERKRKNILNIFKKKESARLQEVPDSEEDEDDLNDIRLEDIPGAVDFNDPDNDYMNDFVPEVSRPRGNIGSPFSSHRDTPRARPIQSPASSNQGPSPNQFREPCQTCHNGTVNYPLLKAAQVKENGIFKFKSDDGKYIYNHIKFPKDHESLSRISDTTLRRRADYLDGLLTLIVHEEEDVQSVKSKAKLIWKYLQRNPEIQKLVRKEIKKTDPESIPMETAVPLLTQLVFSKNKTEKVMAGINEQTIGTHGRIFGIRQDYRDFMKKCELEAVYKKKTVYVELEDKIESLPVVYMKNIKEVLTRYAYTLRDKMEISNRTENSLYLRVGLDKGGLDTKLSLSFANCSMDQSPYNQLVVAAYTGPDTYQFLKETVSKVLGKIQNIKNIKMSGTEIPVKLFLVGDNKSISALLGHGGQACTNPCQICTVDLLSLRKKLDLDNWEIRKEKASLGKGIKHKPLISLPASQIITPPLHDIVGLITMLVGLIIDDSAYIDQKQLAKNPIKKEDLPSQQQKKALVKPNGMLPAKEYEKRKKLVTEFMEKCGKKDDSKKKKKEETDETCSSEWCFKKIGVKVTKAMSERATCESCLKSYHLVCNGIIDPRLAMENFVCAKCSSGEDITGKSLFRTVLDELENSYALARSVRKQSEETGFVAHLDNFMKTNHIERQLYQGGILTGNDAHRFVENIEDALEKFLSFKHDDPLQVKIVQDRGMAYVNMGQALWRIQTFCTNQFLGTDQLGILKHNIAKFTAALKLIPGFHLTVKGHHLKAHFLDFAERWKTIGKFSESYIESGHVHWNRLSLNVGNRPRGGYRLQYLIRNINVRSLILFQCDVDEEIEEDPEDEENY